MKSRHNYYNQLNKNNQSKIPTPIKVGNRANMPIYPKTLNANYSNAQYSNGIYLLNQKMQPQIYVNKPKNLYAINKESKRNNMWGWNQGNYPFPDIGFYSEEAERGKLKPRSVYDIKRPKEKLLKGQNQLILEKLQEKYFLLGKETNTKLMPKTGVNFFSIKKNSFPGHSRKRQLSSHQDKKLITSQRKNSNSNISIDTFPSEFFGSDMNDVNKMNDLNINEGERIYRKLNEELAQAVKKNKNEVERMSIKSKDNLNMNNRNRNEKKITSELPQPLTDHDILNKNNDDDDIQIDDITHNRNQSYKGIDLDEIIKPSSAKRDESIKQSNSNINRKNNINKEEEESNRTINQFTNQHQTNDNDANKSSTIIKSNNSNDSNANADKEEQNKDNEEEFHSNPKEERKRASSSYFNMSNINVAKIINQVFENNRKAAAAQSKDFFQEVGKDYKSNYMRKTQPNFFNSNNKFTDQQQQESSKTLNFLELKIVSPIEWRKHEEIWTNISSLTSLSSDLEKHLIPPNESDVLVSSYIKLFPSVINFCSIGSISTMNQPQSNCLTLSINDRIQNPKLEMKKWKDAYKRVVLRWHPDKLFSLLNEIKLKDEGKRGILKKKSTIIINNMNLLFKQIMEILKKINLAKSNSNGKD